MHLIAKAVFSGIAAGSAAALAASWAGWRETGSYAAPLNATSHIVWGDAAALRNEASLKYTATGSILHYSAALFWAGLYGLLPGRAPLRATVTSAIAYVVDYHVVPSRLTPGFEKRLSGVSLAKIYAALALGLWAGEVLGSRFTKQSRVL